ncbi:MAG: Holliday junction branch migration protein RuvA [Leptospirillia bacterium]
MIARLFGTIEEAGPDWVILRAGAVGYRVLLSPYAMSQLPAPEKETSLRTFLLWSEHQETPLLVGFLDAAEEELFHEIRRIGGLGPTKAIRMISLSPANFWDAIASGDVGRLRKLKGVGETTAKKLVSELRDRVPSLISATPPDVTSGDSPFPEGRPSSRGAVSAVREALVTQFGHSPSEADAMIRRALSRNPSARTEEELFHEVYRHGVD